MHFKCCSQNVVNSVCLVAHKRQYTPFWLLHAPVWQVITIKYNKETGQASGRSIH